MRTWYTIGFRYASPLRFGDAHALNSAEVDELVVRRHGQYHGVVNALALLELLGLRCTFAM